MLFIVALKRNAVRIDERLECRRGANDIRPNSTTWDPEELHLIRNSGRRVVIGHGVDLTADERPELDDAVLAWHLRCINHEEADRVALGIFLLDIAMVPGEALGVNVETEHPVLLLTECIEEALLTPRATVGAGVLGFHTENDAAGSRALDETRLEPTVSGGLGRRRSLNAKSGKSSFRHRRPDGEATCSSGEARRREVKNASRGSRAAGRSHFHHRRVLGSRLGIVVLVGLVLAWRHD